MIVSILRFGIEPQETTISLESLGKVFFGQEWPFCGRNVAFVTEKSKCLDCCSLESGVEIEFLVSEA